MPTAVLNQPNLRVHLTGERLHVCQYDREADREKALRTIPLRDVDRLVAGEDTHFTPRALAAILRQGIPIQFFSWGGKFLGNFLPAQNHHGLTRLHQYQRTLDTGFSLCASARVVAAKLYNQRRTLQRLSLSRNNGESAPGLSTSMCKPGISATLAWMDSLRDAVRTAGSAGELRGYEGAFTARYFSAWATFLPAEFPFEHRSTRPPLNPVNACISFGATLVFNEMVSFLHGHGLDPALGLLHATEDGRWSLALDLIEPFRPILVEALALDLFSHRILGQNHFDRRDGGCFLNEEGRKKFFLQYERRMERQFMSEAVGHRTTLRRQLEQQAVDFKASLEDMTRLQPFLVN